MAHQQFIQQLQHKLPNISVKFRGNVLVVSLEVVAGTGSIDLPTVYDPQELRRELIEAGIQVTNICKVCGSFDCFGLPGHSDGLCEKCRRS